MMVATNRNIFPRQGTDWEEIRRELHDLKQLDVDWMTHPLPGYLYYFGEEILENQLEAHNLYSLENGLGAGVAFFSLEKMLNDIYDWVRDLYHGPDTMGMTFTSGGTESLFEAIRTARNRARARGMTDRLNLVIPYTAHPAVDKAAQIMEIDIVRVPVGAECRADVEAMAAAINDQTFLILGSAVCYPFGVYDPIEKLGELALERDLWLHVDGCWGGFINPFAKQLGYPVPKWDLEVPGVMSMSTDLHKFAYSTKGASLMLQCHQENKDRFETFSISDWPCGTYETPAFQGSSGAGSIASAWAMIKFLGNEGYLKTAKAAMDATVQLTDGVNAIEGLRDVRDGAPVEGNSMAVMSIDPEVDIMAVADLLDEGGWHCSRMRKPLAIKHSVTPHHLSGVEKFLKDTATAVERVRREGLKGEYDERTY